MGWGAARQECRQAVLIKLEVPIFYNPETQILLEVLEGLALLTLFQKEQSRHPLAFQI